MLLVSGKLRADLLATSKETFLDLLLTSSGAGPSGGSSLVTKVRDIFVRAFVRMGEGGAAGAV